MPYTASPHRSLPCTDESVRLISRRRLLGAAALAAGAAVLPGPRAAMAASGRGRRARAACVRRAYRFVVAMTDAYTSGPELRLAQSYADQIGLFSTAFTYDNALAVNALRALPFRVARERARRLGDALLFAQNNDPDHDDGRLRQAYNVGPYVFYDGTPQPDRFVRQDGKANIGWQFGFTGTAVGDMAWAGIALAQLAAQTGDTRYLAGALRIGEWIVTNTHSNQPLGGYTFGVDGSNNPITVSSTEHNIDAHALFTQLGRLTADHAWTTQAEHARDFVTRMWEPRGGFFYTGTNDGTTVNPDPLPLDPQTWSWQALRERRFAGALDWAEANLRTTDTPEAPNSELPDGVALTGVAFSTASLGADPETWDPHAVWLEGTGQLAASLRDRNHAGDAARAGAHLDQIELAQRALGAGQTAGGRALPPRSGVVAASSPMDTGFGFGYFQAQHVGATAWYVMAAKRVNPFHLGQRP